MTRDGRSMAAMSCMPIKWLHAVFEPTDFRVRDAASRACRRDALAAAQRVSGRR